MNPDLQRIYARIPEVHCRGLCQEACGLTGMSPVEAKAIKDRVGERFTPTIGTNPILLISKTGVCPLLNPDGKCSVYEDRPAVCRLFGAVKAMRCPHGCRPKKWLRESESRAILRAIENL